MGLRSIRISVGISVLLLVVIACNIPGPASPVTTQPMIALTLTSLVKTLTAQAGPVSTATPVVVEATETPLISPIPPQSYTEASATPIIPPTDTSSPSPVIPLISVGVVTNCRTGPSQYYKLIGAATVGTKFTVVGKNTPTNYWVIQLADGRECWLWGQYAAVEGDVNSLPEYSPPAFGRIEGELRKSSNSDAGKIAQATVNIGMGFADYETGNDGKFVFEDVPAGEIKFKITHSYYKFLPFSEFVSAGQLTLVIKTGLVPYIATLPPRTPTPRPCPILRPNCLFLPTLVNQLP